MAATKISGKDLRGLRESDIDDLLSKLTAEELEELHMELVDPDVSQKNILCLKNIEYKCKI